jgi:hypothetical protein
MCAPIILRIYPYFVHHIVQFYPYSVHYSKHYPCLSIHRAYILAAQAFLCCLFLYTFFSLAFAMRRNCFILLISLRYVFLLKSFLI